MTQEIELIKEAEVVSEDVDEGVHLLEKCRFYWDSLQDFRDRRKRSRKYYRGDQWSDQVRDPSETSTTYITEEDYIKDQGRVPLKQNIIRQIVKNLIGQYRANPTKTQVIARAKEDGTVSEMLSNALQAAKKVNVCDELDARLWEEFAISGAPIQKVSYRYWHTRNLEDLYLENVNPNRIFFNSDLSDVRLHDLRLIGEVIDTTLDDIIVNFARYSSPERIKAIYSGRLTQVSVTEQGLESSKLDDLSFYIPIEKDKCRLFEIWEQRAEKRVLVHDPMDGSYEVVTYSLDEIAQMNTQRLITGRAQGFPDQDIPLLEAREHWEKIWYVRFVTPTGHVLYEGESPYAHESHPYALTLYPLVDGEVFSLVEDIIDQQRYINRLIIMMDFIISASAKGVLLVPEDSIPDDMDIEDFADEWARFNGVIKYKPKPGIDAPQQVAVNSINIGIQEMLAFQLKFIQEVSGVHEAIMGEDPKSGTPASLYAQSAQNSSLNNLDYMEAFRSFKQTRDMKALKVITQFYNEKRYLAIAGNIYREEAAVYDPERAKDLDYDVVVTEGMNTPVYRTLIEDTLKSLLEAQAIDIELYLEHSTLPFADKLLQAIRQRKEELAQGVAGNASIPPELMQQAQGGDPRAMQMLQQAVGG